jgi:heterotetrameric sarcosine oxidase gamma subunit
MAGGNGAVRLRAGGPPIARSPIAPAPPVAIVEGWEVSRCESTRPLTVSDRTPLAKVLVHAAADGPYARTAAAGFGRAARVAGGVLEIGSGVGEWLMIGPIGSAGDLIARAAARTDAELVSVIDVTHGRALVRLTGGDAAAVVSKLCGVDLADHVTANLAAFRSLVANVVTDVVRDDVAGVLSYLLHCERASGQYLFDVLVDAGAEYGLEVAGFADEWSA